MRNISPAEFANTWNSVAEDWMSKDYIVEKVAQELGVTEKEVKRAVKKFVNAGQKHKLQNID